MAGYSTTPNYANGEFYGPLAAPGAGFPAGVYVSAGDYATWQADVAAQYAAGSAALQNTAASGQGGPASAAASAAAAAAADAAFIAANTPAQTTPAQTTPAQTTPSTTTTPATTGTSTPASTAAALSPAALTGGRDKPLVLGEDYCFWYPDDPLCYDYGAGASPVGTGGGGGGDTTTIIESGLSATDVTSAIQGGLAALWAVAVDAIDVVIGDVISGIQAAITALGNALLAAWQILSRLAGFILTFLKLLFEDVVKGILAALQDIKKALQAIVGDVLVPLVKALGSIRQAIIDVYQRVIRPLILILQQIRQVLAILKLFHIGFATKLDAALTKLEAKLTAPIFFLLSYVNGVANWINLILTVGYLLQKPLWLNSLKAYSGSTLTLQLNAMTTPVDPAALAAANAANAPPTPEQSSADFQTYLQTGGGNNADAIAQNSTLFQQILEQGF